MRALLRAGADVNRTCRGQGRTALFEAALMGDLASVEFLLDALGVMANRGVADWMSPLYAAASGGFLEVVKRLARVDGESVKNGAAADIAKWKGHTECWKLLADLAKRARREVLQERRAKTRRLDTEYIPDHHHAPVADHIERVEIPVAAAVARASRLLAPDSAAWTRQAQEAGADDLHRGVESDSDLESEDGLGGRNGEDSDTESHSDNNSEADLDSDSANSDMDGSDGD
jgi:ankyrin repeat protein